MFKSLNETSVFPVSMGASSKAACDKCRKRKIRCIKKANGACVNCTSLGSNCKYLYVRKPRGRKKGEKAQLKHQVTPSHPTNGELSIVFEYPSPPTYSTTPDYIQCPASPELHSCSLQPGFLNQPYDFTMPNFNDLRKYSLLLN
ncbi:hypothetical protein DSO57_1007991 [Entomophthora muscae]|uniref:Uncharacterized protein n=1 Tax=Entomophthora muscae TaxID=34485 RepID=A0ACC2TIK4_9FUNG|nr:hypothetical protein DSO57_1007991 [Entomophthora muscae]